MKKYLYSVLVMALFAISFAASDDSGSTSSVTTEDVPESMESVTAAQMLSDLKQNEMRAQKMYSGKWLMISGTLGNMDSDGKYFTLKGDDEFSLANVQCYLPGDKKEEFVNRLINMNKGQHLVVKGKVTDMGEVMGYHVEIVEMN